MISGDLSIYWTLPAILGAFGLWTLIKYFSSAGREGGLGSALIMIAIAGIWGGAPLILASLGGGTYPRGYVPPDYVGICAREVRKLVGHEEMDCSASDIGRAYTRQDLSGVDLLTDAMVAHVDCRPGKRKDLGDVNIKLGSSMGGRAVLKEWRYYVFQCLAVPAEQTQWNVSVDSLYCAQPKGFRPCED